MNHHGGGGDCLCDKCNPPKKQTQQEQGEIDRQIWKSSKRGAKDSV